MNDLNTKLLGIAVIGIFIIGATFQLKLSKLEQQRSVQPTPSPTITPFPTSAPTPQPTITYLDCYVYGEVYSVTSAEECQYIKNEAVAEQLKTIKESRKELAELQEKNRKDYEKQMKELGEYEDESKERIEETVKITPMPTVSNQAARELCIFNARDNYGRILAKLGAAADGSYAITAKQRMDMEIASCMSQYPL